MSSFRSSCMRILSETSTRPLRPPQFRSSAFRPRRSYAASPFPNSSRSSILRPLNLLVCIIPIFTFSLGVWQVRRLKWKVALIDEIQSNIEREPIILPPHINLDALPDFAFRRVLLKGQLAQPPILLGPAVQHGAPGYYLIQPFLRDIGSTILLNRGFITTTRATAIREGKQVAPPPLPESIGPDGDVIVEGMLSKRFTEGQGRWDHDNQPEENQWFWKDLKAMAEWCGGDEKKVQAVLVDAIDHGDSPTTLLLNQGTPIGKPPTIELRNQHATYALTWFSLSFATAGMLVFLLRRGSGKKLAKTVRPII